MTNNKNKSMQFLFADRELLITVGDLLAAPVDVIVNPANGNLTHGGGVAAQISQQGGDIIQSQSELFIKEHGTLESGMVALTDAGRLPFQSIIHAIGPEMGEGDEQNKIQQAVARSLQLCEMHDWKSIAFPAISTGIISVPLEISARAFFLAITSFWDARLDGAPEKIIICLTENNFSEFFNAFQQISKTNNGDIAVDKNTSVLNKTKEYTDVEPEISVVNLSEKEIKDIESDDDVNDWFN